MFPWDQMFFGNIQGKRRQRKPYRKSRARTASKRARLARRRNRKG